MSGSRIPPDTTVAVSWDTTSEKVAARVDHAMLVLPEGEKPEDDPQSSHRLYFTGTATRQAQLCAVVVDYMIRTGLDKLVTRILKDNPERGEIRGLGTPAGFCPCCGREK